MKPAAFMFTAGQDCPVIAVAQTSSRANSAAAWAIYAQCIKDSREQVVIFDASRRLQVSVCLTMHAGNARGGSGLTMRTSTFLVHAAGYFRRAGLKKM